MVWLVIVLFCCLINFIGKYLRVNIFLDCIIKVLWVQRTQLEFHQNSLNVYYYTAVFYQAYMSFMPTNSVMHLIWQLVALTLINTMYPKCCVQDLRPFWSVCLENSAVGSSSESWAPRGPASPLSWTFLLATGKRACMHREGMFQNLVSVYQCLAFLFILIKLSVPNTFFLQRDRHERSDPG